MSTHPAPELLHYWAKGDLTVEQATGHILQNLVALLQRLNEMEKRLRQLEQSGAPNAAKMKDAIISAILCSAPACGGVGVLWLCHLMPY